MSWKGRNYPAVIVNKPVSKMIEHSIHKYELPKVTHIPYIEKGNFATKYWSKIDCDIYIEQLANRGYVVGAPIKTKYGFLGKILSIREIPIQGLNFSEERPNMFIIQKKVGNDYSQPINNLLYGEHELELLTETHCAC